MLTSTKMPSSLPLHSACNSILDLVCTPLHSIAVTPANIVYLHAFGVNTLPRGMTFGLIYPMLHTPLRHVLKSVHRLPENFVMHALYQVLSAVSTYHHLHVTIDTIYYDNQLRIRVLESLSPQQVSPCADR